MTRTITAVEEALIALATIEVALGNMENETYYLNLLTDFRKELVALQPPIFKTFWRVRQIRSHEGLINSDTYFTTEEGARIFAEEMGLGQDGRNPEYNHHYIVNEVTCLR